ITVSGATERFTMEIDFGLAGSDTLSQVTARLQPIRYVWEVFDVTNLRPDEKDAAAASKAGTASISPASGEVRDMMRSLAATSEDTKADVEDALSGPPALVAVTWPARMAWLQVVAISDVVRIVGAPLSSFISLVSRPLNEQSIGFDHEGE